MIECPAIEIQAFGGPDALRIATVNVDVPGKGQLLVRQTAIGVNYHDIYVRTGLYKTLALPGIPGIEAVGVVEAVGDGVTNFNIGDRIGYVSPEYGAYAARRLLAADRAAILPAGLDDVSAAGSLMKAMTACMLLRKVHDVQPGEFILVHAAAGGVGQMLCRWGRYLGATVIGTVGNRDKAATALNAGAHHTILYREEDFVSRVMDITAGAGVSAVYDSVGEDTFIKSLSCLDYCGKLVNFGQSSGPVSPFAPSLLAGRSASVCRPIVFHYLRGAASMQSMANQVFNAFAQGALVPLPAQTFPLAQAPEAHRVLEARLSPGAVVLIP